MLNNSNTIIVTVNGFDQPGVTSSLTEILQDHNIEILDMSQSVIHQIHPQSGAGPCYFSAVAEGHTGHMVLAFYPYTRGHDQIRHPSLIVPNTIHLVRMAMDARP